MMTTLNLSSGLARVSWSVLLSGTVLLTGSTPLAGQSRIIRPPTQSNSSASGKRQPVANLRSSDSPEGSRVAVTSNQSLNNYEAYRRGDRFYVRIPAADVPRAEATRGRGFADVKAQRNGDSTVVSFRLQPGATAHVEQRANKLEVVFTMPGARNSGSSPSLGSNVGRPINRSGADQTPRIDPKKRSNTNSADPVNPLSARNSGLSSTNSALPARPGSANSSSSANSAKPGATGAATPVSTPRPSPTAKPSVPDSSAKTLPVATASPAGQPASTKPAEPTQSAWSKFKERARYLMLMAELNPVPVAIGAAVLLLLVGLLILQRKRAKGTRRTRPKPDAKKAKPAPITTATAPGPTVTERVAPTTPVVAEALVSPAVSAAAVAPAIIAATPVVTERGAPPEPRAAVAAPVSRDATRQERVAQVAEEVKKLMAGGDYDQNVVASDDRDTRQLVGAELLSALVGRNIQRRERARAAFMQHGYFDDATRDLRIAESANERAAAARRLSFAHDREATPHLIAALDDSAPDVRRAAVEALMDMRDPAAIAPLNSLMQTENDRKVPRTLIKHAIEACATNGPQVDTPVAASLPAAPVSHPSSPPVEPDREVIEL